MYMYMYMYITEFIHIIGVNCIQMTYFGGNTPLNLNHQLFLVSLRVEKNLNIHLDIPRVYEKKDSSQQGRLHA